MKKFKLLISSLFLAMALLFVSASPVKVYANDIDDPQGTSEKKAAPPQIPPDLLIIIFSLLRMW